MLKRMDDFYRECARQWCHFAHSDSMWPVNGRYRCRTCFRTYPVPWANANNVAESPARKAPIVKGRSNLARMFDAGRKAWTPFIRAR